MNKFVDATCTPLSSIFGSGFLTIVPILAGAVDDHGGDRGHHAGWVF
jgi:hypothetical protein